MATLHRYQWRDAEIDRLRGAGLERERVPMNRRRPGYLEVDGREYVDMASNDYLGLAADPRINAAVSTFLLNNGWGAGASPLISGYHPAHAELERELADFEGCESVLCLGSGFVANFGTLAAIASEGDVIFSESRNHASLIDGCRLSRAKVEIYQGNRLEDLEERLRQATGYLRRIVVTDSVFSMEGDIAPLHDLCDLADRFDAILYVDEAHATGVLGRTGRGVAELLGVEDRVPLRMGTLSKSLGSVGGFLVADSEWIQYLLHKSRTYVYSTALPAACAVAASTALKILRGEPERKDRVCRLADQVRARLRAVGVDCGRSATPILPIVIGDPERTMKVADFFRNEGFWTGAIRPPTVPIATSRLRVSLNCAIPDHEIERFVDLFDKTKSF
ncbi:MAG: 8-amino-7-oxononanoate synthase [Planctomycetota bacterium]